MKSLEHYWYQPNIFSWLLLPLSWLYCLIVIIRRRCYQLNILTSHSAAVPVAVIGNIVAGGSGKTPLLISICEYLQDQGYRAGVVSRGYGGKVRGIKQVLPTDTADLVGDEPLMISCRTGVPVVVGADRVAAVEYLLKNNDCDIVLSDDGLQHYRMKRQLEIAVIDAQRKFGNGFCLPAGPMRELRSRLNDVDIVVYNGNTGKSAETCCYELAVTGVSRLNSDDSRTLASFAGKTVHAVAGIGYPQRFFSQLRSNGITIVEHAYADHYNYQQRDFSGWQNECIIMTEKDAVKCQDLFLHNAWVLTVHAEISSELLTNLNSKLLPLIAAQAE